MRKKLFFSVLVPNLGYSDLVEECIVSLSNLELLSDFDFEIIICDQSELDIFNKIKLLVEKNLKGIDFQIVHQEKGLIKARETLMKLAKGDYFCFVDSDDYVEKTFLINRFLALKTNNYPDLLISNYKVLKEGILNKHKFKDGVQENPKDFFLFSSNLNPMWIKTFKKELYPSIHIYDKSILNGEDWIVSYSLVKNAKSLTVDINNYDYVYRLNNASVSHNLSISAAYQQIFYRKEYLQNEHISSSLQSSLFLENQVRIFNISCKLVIKNKSMNYNKFCEFFKDCKTYIKQLDRIHSYKRIKFKNRFFLFLMRFNCKRIYYFFLKKSSRKV